MDPSEWMRTFKALHELAKRPDGLTEAQRKDYGAMRDEFARSMAQAQGLTIPDGKTARHVFKVAHSFQLELDNMYNVLTKEVWRTGFMALVPTALAHGQRVSFKLTLSRADEPVTGEATVLQSIRQAGNARTTFEITLMNEGNGERLETAIFSAAIARY